MREAELSLQNDICRERQGIGIHSRLLLSGLANSLTSRACDSC